MLPLPVHGKVSHDAPRSSLGKRMPSLKGKQTEWKQVLLMLFWHKHCFGHRCSHLCFWRRRGDQVGSARSQACVQTPRGQRSSAGQSGRTTRSQNVPPAAGPLSRNSVKGFIDCCWYLLITAITRPFCAESKRRPDSLNAAESLQHIIPSEIWLAPLQLSLLSPAPPHLATPHSGRCGSADEFLKAKNSCSADDILLKLLPCPFQSV